MIERAVILSNGKTLRLDLSLPESEFSASADRGRGREAPPADDGVLTETEMKALQKKNLLAALRRTDWRISGQRGAAELLGVRPTTLADRIRSYGIKKPD